MEPDVLINYLPGLKKDLDDKNKLCNQALKWKRLLYFKLMQYIT